MEIVFAVAVIVFSLTYMIAKFSAFGLHHATALFLFCSLIFLHIGYLVRAVETGGGVDRWAYRGLFVVSVGVLCIMVGAIMQEVISGRPKPYREVEISDGNLANRRLIVAAIVTLGPAWLYFVFLGYVPLFSGVNAVASDGLTGLGELQAARLSRDGYASAQGVHIPAQGLMQLARNVGAPMTAAYAAAQLAILGRTKLRIVVLLAASITVLLAGQRWPLIYLGLALVAGLALTKVPIPKRTIARMTATVLIIGVAISLMQSRTLSTFADWMSALSFAGQNLFNRIFFEQSIVPTLSYQYAVYEPGSLLGRSYVDSLLAYLPGPSTSFPVEFYTTVTGDRFSYTAAPDFYTEAYINFGMFGVIVTCLIWGAVLAQFSRFQVSQDRMLNAGVGGGMVAVLAQSCYTGAVFTLGGFLMGVLVLVATTRLVRERTVKAMLPNSKEVSC